jgi:hypothetical protein
LDVRTTATLPYFLILTSTTPPTFARAGLAAKLTSVRPLDKVLTPVAAIAGMVARAATAAPPQIKPRLDSATTYFFPKSLLLKSAVFYY